MARKYYWLLLLLIPLLVGIAVLIYFFVPWTAIDKKKSEPPDFGTCGIDRCTSFKTGIIEYSKEKVEEHNVPPDGSCLFHSISRGLGDNAPNAAMLRQGVVDILRYNPEFILFGAPLEVCIEHFVDENNAPVTLKEYADYMEKGSTYGTVFEVGVLSVWQKVTVQVFLLEELDYKRIYLFKHPSAAKTVNILLYGYNHYKELKIQP